MLVQKEAIPVPNLPQPPAAVALDMDGLLFDTESIYFDVNDTILRQRGLRFDAVLQRRMMGRIGTAATQQMIDHHGLHDTAETLLAESDSVYAGMLSSRLRPMMHCQQFIDRLRTARLPFAVTTSSRRRFTDVILATVDWAADLQFVLCGDDVARGKPDPEIYLRAADRFGVPPRSMMVLEDSQHGVAAALAAGAITVAVPNLHTADHDFTGAALIAKSLGDPALAAMLGNGEVPS